MRSQNDEEKFILDYFGGGTGTLCDIGANDGITLSNSYTLVEQGWEGMLVEASQKAFERLAATHNIIDRQVQLLNVAVGSYDGVIEFNESGQLLGTGDVALVSSTRQDEMDRWVSLNMPFEKMTVPVITFKTLLQRSAYNHFDFLTIDIEGMEPEVVPQIDFTALGVRMAIIEWNGKNPELYDGLLASHGLKLIHINGENRLYAK
jgi:FkbM family methyltransferase